MDKWHKEVVASELKTEKKVLNELHKTYEEASKQIDDKIAQLLGRSDANMQHVIYQVQYQQALKKQVDGILDTLNGTQFTTVSDYLQKSYEDGFIGTLYTLQKQGVPLAFPIDQELVTRSIINNSKISEGLYKKLGFDVGELKKNIRSEISRGISTDASYADIARNVNNQMGIGLNKSIRIARTEGHRISQESRYDAMTKAKEAGADVVKQWDSTLDKRTRPHHQALDGQVRELDEPFEVAGRKALQPSGFGVASEDINCRCVVLEIGRWELDDDTGSTKMVDGEIKDFSSAKDYEDFKKQYWAEGLNTLNGSKPNIAPKSLAEQSIVKLQTLPNTQAFTNVSDAEGFATKTFGIKTDYSTFNIEVANKVNDELSRIYSVFGDVHKAGYLEEIREYPKRANWEACYSPPWKTVFFRNVGAKTSLKKMKHTAEGQHLAGFWTTGDAEHAIRHEIGHAIQHWKCDNDVKKALDVKQLWEKTCIDVGVTPSNPWTMKVSPEMAKAGQQLSYYALRNEKEFVAEAVAEFMGGNPRQLAIDVVNILLR